MDRNRGCECWEQGDWRGIAIASHIQCQGNGARRDTISNPLVAEGRVRVRPREVKKGRIRQRSQDHPHGMGTTTTSRCGAVEKSYAERQAHPKCSSRCTTLQANKESRERTWPPMSHSLIVTLPFVTLRMLKPTVGSMSSVYCPDCQAQRSKQRGEGSVT